VSIAQLATSVLFVHPANQVNRTHPTPGISHAPPSPPPPRPALRRNTTLTLRTCSSVAFSIALLVRSAVVPCWRGQHSRYCRSATMVPPYPGPWYDSQAWCTLMVGSPPPPHTHTPVAPRFCPHLVHMFQCRVQHCTAGQVCLVHPASKVGSSSSQLGGCQLRGIW
jgi:hypothetical protein